jgi:hypothetical protein
MPAVANSTGPAIRSTNSVRRDSAGRPVPRNISRPAARARPILPETALAAFNNNQADYTYTPDREVGDVKTTWRLWFIAALMPVSGMVQAAGYFDGALQSSASFDEVLEVEPIQQVTMTMLEPDLAEAPTAPPPPNGVAGRSSAAASSSTVAGAMQSGSMSGCDSCGDSCCDLGSCCCGPTWTVRAGAVILERSRPKRQRVIEDRTGSPDREGYTDAFDFGFEGGPDVTITRWLANGNGIEVRYFGALEWDANASWQSDTGWAVPTNPPRTGGAPATINANYISRLNSTEVNYRQAPNDRVSLLAGFRWVELHEELGVDADFGANMTDIGWNVDNHLYGAQSGAEVMLLDRGGPMQVTSHFKGGIFGNAADNDFSLNQSVGPDVSFNDSTSKVTFLGDIAFLARYRFNDNVSFNSGYQLLWLDGVALASEQIFATNVINGSGIDADGFVFYHGALISMDVIW